MQPDAGDRTSTYRTSTHRTSTHRMSLRRLAILTNGTLPQLGGAERSCWDRACGFARAGVEVRMLVPDLAGTGDRYPDRRRYLGDVEPGLRVVAYPSKPFSLYPDNRQPRHGPGMAAIERELTDFRPDLLLVVEPEGLTLLNGRRVPGVTRARRAGLPVVFECHTLFAELAVEYLGAWSRLPAQAMVAATFRQADATVAFSEWAAGRLRSAGVRNVTALPFPGVDLAAYSPANRTRPRFGGPGAGPLRVLYAGRLAEEKRLAILPPVVAALRAAGRVADLRLVGAGPLEGDLRRLSEYVGLAGRAGDGPCVALPGVLRGAALAREYADADVFVNPCPHETFGLAALEAMASGTPAVVPAESGSVAFVVDGVNGLAVRGLDEGRLAAALAALHDRPERLAAMAAAAPAVKGRFALSAVCGEQLELLGRVLAGHRDRRSARRGRFPA